MAEVGFEAAALVPGLGNVERVKGSVDIDPVDGKDVYSFAFLIDSGRDPEQRGLTYIRLIQRLREKLEARKDRHLPSITILDRAGWELRKLG